MNCFLVRDTAPIVNLGKYGDLIAILPALRTIFQETGAKPVVIVSDQYANLFDGVSYVEPVPVTLDWPKGTVKAREFAIQKYGRCVVPQFWNDPETANGIPKGGTVIELAGHKWAVDAGVWPDYVTAMWARLGFNRKEMLAGVPVFDRRDRRREEQLIARHIHTKKPTILLNLHSTSSPFGHEPELMLQIPRGEFHIVNLADVQAVRIYDLLGLFDAAAGLITVATATLHLAAASKIPYIAFTEDGWSRAVAKGNCVLNLSYGHAANSMPAIKPIVSGWQKKADTRWNLDYENPPSITQQCPWTCQMFDFTKSSMPPYPGVDYFNCGMVARNDGDWLVVRRSRWRANMAFGMNDLLAFKLNGMTPTEAKEVKIQTSLPDEHFEDPRVFQHNGRTFVSANNFVWGNVWPHAHQVLVEMRGNDWASHVRHDVVCGHNGSHTKANTGSEKNWNWFFDRGVPLLIYLIQPHTIVQFDQGYRASKIYEMDPQGINWPYGSPRGGTPPVLVEGEYWTFFHSSVGAGHFTRRYFMGAYAFEAQPPYRMTRFVKRPLLVGSKDDVWAEGKPLVVFPCGSIFRNGNWTVSLGVNDLACAWIEIPHRHLVDMTVAVSHSINLRQEAVRC